MRGIERLQLDVLRGLAPEFLHHHLALTGLDHDPVAAPILNIGTVIKESTIRLVSSAQAPLREPKDCVGKVIGIPSEGGESETTLDLLLASSGIEPESVQRQVVGVGPGVFNLVEQGRISGFIVSIDTAKPGPRGHWL